MLEPVELAQRLRARGLKLTPQRQLIFGLMFDNTGHPTADAVFSAARAEMPMISLKTVYQILNDLADLGEVQALDLGTGSIRFDPNVDEHQHAVCDRCGTVFDVVLAAAPELLGADGFVVHDIAVTFRGICGACTAPKQS